MTHASERRLVALALPPGPQFLAALDHTWARGDAVLPLAADAPRAVRARTLDALRPHTLVDASGDHVLPDPLPVADDVALVVATSGSTGPAKGVELTHDALRASARAGLTRIGADASDRWLSCLPLHHIAGIQVLVRAQLAGVPPVVHARFDAAAVARERDVTLVSLVPTMLRRLLDTGADVGRFRCILLGGAAPPPRLLEEARAAGARVVQSYGMTETCGGCVYDGVPLDGVQVRVDAGRILVAGHVLMRGYRNAPEHTAEVLHDGWLRTADLGRWTADGRLEVLGRADDVIVTGGEKVRATFVADLLAGHPQVAEAAVVGRPDPEWGERVVAVVVPAGTAPTLDELRRHVAERAPAHAAPRELVIVEALRRGPLGKVRVDELPA